MIQRIQTVYLSIGVLLVAASFLLGRIWAGPVAVEFSWFTPVTLALYSLAVVGGAISIFLYKHRERQIQAVFLVGIVTLLGLISLVTGLLLSETYSVASDSAVDPQLWMGLAFPVFGMVFFFLARRGITKDVELLRSVDRLR